MKREGSHLLFVGTRHSNGKFGPHINLDDERISGLIRLYQGKEDQDRYRFPDLSPLIHVIHNQLEAGFQNQQRYLNQQINQEKNRELAEKYEILFDQWNTASSIENEEKKIPHWKDVISLAREVLIRLREEMPDHVPVKEWNLQLAEKTEQTGRMYTEALLFIIYGRAAYEGSTLGRDPTLRKYCSQLKEKVKTQLAGENRVNLMLCAAFHRQKDYSIVWRLLGMQNQDEANASLLDHIRELQATCVEDNNSYYRHYSSHVQDTYRRNLETPHYTDAQWDMLCVLWNIYDRVCRLEDLLEGLEKHGQKVDFTQTPETHEVMKQLLDQLHTQEISVLPHAE
ncbi:hypothetical protein [Pantoea agglomerans]|uniref:hypothetical protein n=1 Tax=Enterobacter agglomerans TaxID=549 RepID=UPI0016547C63|nr:hypothetical protein [Pantoea agglomerans]